MDDDITPPTADNDDRDDRALPSDVPPATAKTSDQIREDIERQAVEVRRRNEAVHGTLTLHYRSRDVMLDVDGATAITIMTAWSNRPTEPSGLSRFASATWRWIGLDLDELCGCFWAPDDPVSAPASGARMSVMT